MGGKLIRLEKKLNTFVNAVQSAFEKFHKDIESFNKRFDVINDKLNTSGEKVNLPEGRSSSDIEVSETGFNNVKTGARKKCVNRRKPDNS